MLVTSTVGNAIHLVLAVQKYICQMSCFLSFVFCVYDFSFYNGAVKLSSTKHTYIYVLQVWVHYGFGITEGIA